jgi:hypothetical protein
MGPQRPSVRTDEIPNTGRFAGYSLRVSEGTRTPDRLDHKRESADPEKS